MQNPAQQILKRCNDFFTSQRPPWKDLKRCLEYAKEIKRKHNLTELPGPTKLREMGYKTFVNGIAHHQKGGIKAIKKLLGEKVQTKEKNHKRQVNEIKNCLKTLWEYLRKKQEHTPAGETAQPSEPKAKGICSGSPEGKRYVSPDCWGEARRAMISGSMGIIRLTIIAIPPQRSKNF